MAKKLLFSLVFTCFQVFAFASGIWRVQYCDAPAPTNFEVTSMGSDLVTLGWDPSVAGATHTLALMVEENGDWKSLWVNHQVPGDAIVLDNLEPGNYLARLATNCETGETGEEFTDLPIRFKIIDLTIIGRMPKNPKVVENCQQIDYLNHKWTGFRVTEIATGLTNYFEFVWSGEGGPAIKRVYNNHPIVAVKENGQFPSINVPILTTKVPFRIDYITSNEVIQVGYITCLAHQNPSPILELCVEDNNPPIFWKDEFIFEAVVAEEIQIEVPNAPQIKSEENSMLHSLYYPKIKIESPFLDIATMFFPEGFSNESDLDIQVIDLTGRILRSFHIGAASQTVDLPLFDLPHGSYFFRLNLGKITKIIKAVKV